MKFLTKIKSIYLLAIVAILSFCMVLFPALPSFASATEGEEPETGTEVVVPEEGEGTEDVTVEMGTGTVKIVSATTVVQTYTEGDKVYGEGEEKKDKAGQWALMFKAQITREEYDNITVGDTALVKFGMLVGPTKLLESVVHTENGIYADLVTAGFESFAYVGSSKSNGQDLGKMFNEKGVAEYLGGIVYDATRLGNLSIGYAALDLTAIPFYMNADTPSAATTIVVDYDAENDVFGSSKAATPRSVLTEIFVRQQAGQYVVPEDEVEIDISTIQGFVAQVNGLTYPKDKDGTAYEAYICRSTNRVMVGLPQGELAPLDMVTDGNTIGTSFAGKNIVATGVADVDDTLEETMVQGLPMYKEGVSGQGNFIIYGANAITVYQAKVAERVIMRFADTHTGNFSKFEDGTYRTEDGEYNYTNTINETKDFLASADLVLSANRKSLNSRRYLSIFAINSSKGYLYGGPTTNGAYYVNMANSIRVADRCFDGLYVLGKNVDAYDYTKSGDLDYAVESGGTYDASGAELVREITEADTDRIRIARVTPAAGTGFVGTFDGRGMKIDFRGKASTKPPRVQGGVFPVMFGATVKNVAFLSLTNGSLQEGGAGSFKANGAGITPAARNTTFENIYAEVKNGYAYDSDFNKGILMDIQNCKLKNFVANVNLVNSTVMSKAFNTDGVALASAAGRTGTGVGQGLTTSGAFNFKAFTDMYYSPTDTVKVDGKMVVRFAVTEGQYGSDSFTNPKHITVEQLEEYFPNMINTSDKYVYSLYNADIDTNKVAPFADKYNSMKHKEQANEFVGTTGENVYVIGTSPLYVGHEYAGGRVPDTIKYGQQLQAKAMTTVFVNSDSIPKLADGETAAQVGWRVVENTTTNEETGEEITTTSYVAPTAYKFSELDSTDARFVVNADTTYSLAEIITTGKYYRHGATRMARLLETEELTVRFITQDGFYDCANTTEMAKYLTESNLALFENSGFWKISNGVVTWKNA